MSVRWVALALLATLVHLAAPAAALVELECRASSEGDAATGESSYASSCTANGQTVDMPAEASSGAYQGASLMYDAMLASGACSADGTCVDNDVVSAGYAKNETGHKKEFVGHVSLLK